SPTSTPLKLSLPNSLTLLYMQTERICQLSFPRSQRNDPQITSPSYESEQRNTGRSLPFPKLEIKTFSRLKASFYLFFPSRVYPSHPRIVGDAVDCQHVCRGARIDGMSVGIATEVIEACHHRVLQSFIDDVFPPEISHTILHPLEVRYCDASRIRENIWNYEYTFFIENLIGVCCSRTISSFGQYFAL